MAKSGLSILILGLYCIAPSTHVANAHGGHKKKPAELQAPAAQDSIYSAGDEDSEVSTGEPDAFPLSRSDALGEENLVTSGTMESMDHSAMDSMDPKMPEVEIAKREWVSPKKKGYGMAVGITVFAGLIFGVLHFKRPNE